MTEDTIVAIATPRGRGGIGVVRLSGKRALETAQAFIRIPQLVPEARRAVLGEFVDPATSRALDRVILTFFSAPHSYTGEDVVEIACHGAPVILNYMLECSLAHGARLAEPGEFTLRAFLKGRIDLTQAEAIRDLIDSRTLFQARLAAQQMEGAISARVKPAKQALLDLIAHLEAGIDFAEDDLPVAGSQEISSRVERLRGALTKLAQGYQFGRIVREGLSLAIAGRPNVGKSSLFNCLLKEDRAIVTEIPGTTRDPVAETATIAGIPLRLVDTAGIRDARDEVEKIGVEKSLQAVADSDLRMLVIDVAEGWTGEDERLFRKVRPLGALVVACNKSDLPARVTQDQLNSIFRATVEPMDLSPACGTDELDPAFAAPRPPEVATVWTSARTGEGVEELQQALLSFAAPRGAVDSEGEIITNLRHQQSLQKAVRSLEEARQAAANGVPHEMVLLDLYEALHALDSLTGATTTEDLLGVIFSTFCVGK